MSTGMVGYGKYGNESDIPAFRVWWLVVKPFLGFTTTIPWMSSRKNGKNLTIGYGH